MIQITVKLDGIVTHGPVSFETQELADQWLQSHIGMGTFSFDVIVPATEETEEYIIKGTHTLEIEDISLQYEKEQQEKQLLDIGKLIDSKCKEAIVYITGYNASKGFSFEQIDQLELQFGDIFSALSKNRIDKAYMLLLEVEPDEVLLTEEFIQTLLGKLSL